jgi:hypothetical protein
MSSELYTADAHMLLKPNSIVCVHGSRGQGRTNYIINNLYRLATTNNTITNLYVFSHDTKYLTITDKLLKIKNFNVILQNIISNYEEYQTNSVIILDDVIYSFTRDLFPAFTNNRHYGITILFNNLGLELCSQISSNFDYVAIANFDDMSIKKRLHEKYFSEMSLNKFNLVLEDDLNIYQFLFKELKTSKMWITTTPIYDPNNYDSHESMSLLFEDRESYQIIKYNSPTTLQYIKYREPELNIIDNKDEIKDCVTEISLLIDNMIKIRNKLKRLNYLD